MKKIYIDLRVDEKNFGEMIRYYSDIFKEDFKIIKEDKNEKYCIVRIGKSLLRLNSYRNEESYSLIKYSPDFSFYVYLEEERVSEIYEFLKKDGTILMEIGEYDFSKNYCWVIDKYGISWQISPDDNIKSMELYPFLMLHGENYGQGKLLINEYIEGFGGRTLLIVDDENGNVINSIFAISALKLKVFDSIIDHNFKMEEGIGFRVGEALSENPFDKKKNKIEKENGIDIIDRFGVRWTFDK